MPWPLSQDYNESIQTPAQCFTDPDLRRGEAVANAMGMPVPCSGNFADVYAVASGQHKWAVKCFTRQIPGLKERYAEISKYLPKVQLPFMVKFKYLDQGIRVRNDWYPVLKMQWVEGLALNTFVRGNLENPAILQSICQIWLKLAARLHEANLAHGDLQHGNVLLVQGAKAGTAGIKLVDYDGMCVPALELLKATEVGHPAYQHPQRLRESTYGLQIDNFSHLVIYTALRALAGGGPKLWDRYDNGDNLLFVQEDFEAPTKSALFKELLGHGDGEVRKLTGALIDAARKPVQQTPRLEDLVPSGSRPKTAIPVQAAPQATATSPFALPAASSRFPKRQRGRRGVAVVLIACLVMAGVGLGGFAILRTPPPTDVGVPPTTSTSRPTSQMAKGWLLMEIALLQEIPSPTEPAPPPQAQVYLDGKLVASSSPRVLRLDLAPGKHELRVSKDGFKPYVAQIEVGAGMTKRISVALNPEGLTGESLARRLIGSYRLKYSNLGVTNTALLRFTDDHKMFENNAYVATWKVVGNKIVVTYNDAQWGKAELHLKGDAFSGQNTQKSGVVWTWVLEMLPDDASAVNPPASNKATLVLEIEPEEAEVFLDGKLASASSLKELNLEVPPGKHELKVEKRGYKPHTETVDMTGLAIKRIRVKLERQVTTCKIRNVNSGMYLDVLGASTKDGASVGQWPDQKVKSVLWKIEPLDDGSCKIRNLNSGKVLNVLNASKEAGGRVIQFADRGDSNSLWKIERLDDGSCKIRNVNSGMYLDVLGASTKAGTNVGQWPDGVKSILWKIEPVND